MPILIVSLLIKKCAKLMFEFEIHMIGCLQKTLGDPPKIQIDTFGVFFIHSENIVHITKLSLTLYIGSLNEGIPLFTKKLVLIAYK